MAAREWITSRVRSQVIVKKYIMYSKGTAMPTVILTANTTIIVEWWWCSFQPSSTTMNPLLLYSLWVRAKIYYFLNITFSLLLLNIDIIRQFTSGWLWFVLILMLAFFEWWWYYYIIGCGYRSELKASFDHDLDLDLQIQRMYLTGCSVKFSIFGRVVLC